MLPNFLCCIIRYIEMGLKQDFKREKNVKVGPMNFLSMVQTSSSDTCEPHYDRDVLHE